jgi:hypothetical protein
MKPLLTFALITLVSIASAQTFSTSSINVGGNTSIDKNFNFDWSIGEGCSIETFKSENNLIVTTGVLQPITTEKVFINKVTDNWISGEMSLYPQPSKAYFEVNFSLETMGNIDLELIDQFGRKLESRKINYNRTNSAERFEISHLSASVYYLKAVMTDDKNQSVIKRGTFKIIKL